MAGRRPKPDAEKRQSILQIRVTADEKAKIERAATERGLDVSSFVRMLALGESRKGAGNNAPTPDSVDG